MFTEFDILNCLGAWEDSFGATSLDVALAKINARREADMARYNELLNEFQERGLSHYEAHRLAWNVLGLNTFTVQDEVDCEASTV